MRSEFAARESRLQLWRRVREFAVPATIVDKATARRAAGDWAGACAAARFDVDLSKKHLIDGYGRHIAAAVLGDLRHLAPDLLRWHLPRVSPGGLLRPGVTMTLARYPGVDLVVRTPPGWADAGQRVSVGLWDPGRDNGPRYPHPRPSPRFRLDLHRHLWDARRTGELATRAVSPPGFPPAGAPLLIEAGLAKAGLAEAGERGWAVGGWAQEAAILAAADGTGPLVAVRLGVHRRVVAGGGGVREAEDGDRGLPVLPEASVYLLPDLELLEAGLIEPWQLHPLVAAALTPDAPRREAAAADAGGPRIVDCRGQRHRLDLVGGVLTPLDHDEAELRREALLVAFGGPPLPCLRVIDEAIRRPENLDDVRGRLDHGDAAGAIDVVEQLLGAGAVLRSGALLEELEAEVERQITHGLFRAGLAGGKPPSGTARQRPCRHHRSQRACCLARTPRPRRR